MAYTIGVDFELYQEERCSFMSKQGRNLQLL